MLIILSCTKGAAVQNTVQLPADRFIDPRDGHAYKTVRIGEQEWLAENFAYLPYICEPGEADCGVWVYDYDGSSLTEAKKTPQYGMYGALYSWKAARELAPEGWHVPSDEEWKELERHIGIDANAIDDKTWRGENNEADRLKKEGDTGLEVVFGGWMTDYGKFNFAQQHANFWCADEVDAGRGIERLLGLTNGRIGRDAGNKGCGFSVRYVRDR
ncbi:fibrobacter succinogenes major paralogous domain-containing protein [Roseivirga sp. BDSF3-8]|uniref:fibrobacter succinogenes major paralogous domain-containing protein n=1 Tax=Roseivirga sp. BDSF3-8 TaxID=3241598 RepID=UPI003531CF55